MNNMVKNRCVVEDCNVDVLNLTNQLCGNHYRRFIRTGNPVSPRKIPRPAIFVDDYACIPLGKDAKDGFAKIDAKFSYLDKKLWRISGGYAARAIPPKQNNKGLHRFIMEEHLGRELNSSEVVDHINRDKLDNRVSNLRIVTASQNCYNKGKKDLKTSSKYIGVSWHAKQSKFHATLKFKGTYHYFGSFDDEVEAAKTRDKWALEYQGEHACLNFPGLTS